MEPLDRLKNDDSVRGPLAAQSNSRSDTTDQHQEEEKESNVKTSVSGLAASAAARARFVLNTVQGSFRKVEESLHIRPNTTTAQGQEPLPSQLSHNMTSATSNTALETYKPKPELEDPVLKQNLTDSAASNNSKELPPTRGSVQTAVISDLAGKDGVQGGKPPKTWRGSAQSEAIADVSRSDGSQGRKNEAKNHGDSNSFKGSAQGGSISDVAEDNDSQGGKYYAAKDSAGAHMKTAESTSQLDLYAPPGKTHEKKARADEAGTEGGHSGGHPKRNLGGAEVDPKLLLEGKGTRSRL